MYFLGMFAHVHKPLYRIPTCFESPLQEVIRKLGYLHSFTNSVEVSLMVNVIEKYLYPLLLQKVMHSVLIKFILFHCKHQHRTFLNKLSLRGKQVRDRMYRLYDLQLYHRVGYRFYCSSESCINNLVHREEIW